MCAATLMNRCAQDDDRERFSCIFVSGLAHQRMQTAVRCTQDFIQPTSFVISQLDLDTSIPNQTRDLCQVQQVTALLHTAARNSKDIQERLKRVNGIHWKLCFCPFGFFFYSFKWQLQNSSALFGTFVGVSECSHECHAKRTYVSVKGILSLYSKLMKSARLNIPCMKMAYFQNQSFCISRTWCWNLKPILRKVVKKCRWQLVLCFLEQTNSNN